jgi:argininosuccinate synthase
MPIALAFSGGLDTSFCVPFLRDETGDEVHTVTVNTGGFSPDELAAVERRSAELGAASHQTIDARADLFDDVLRYLIAGNVLRGGVYPLCVGPERVVQAKHVAQAARELGCETVAHGSTGAGNDQVRFDVAMRIVGDGLRVLAPIREHALSREQTTAYLRERGFEVSAKTTDYSINQGLWGTTIGGKETHDTRAGLPPHAYPGTTNPADAPDTPQTITLAFERGIPTALDGDALDSVSLVERLGEVAGAHGVGRGMHVGDTILGIKGRVGFEAPASVTLIAAHRELEKLVLTRWQAFQKAQLGDFYGMLLHEGQYFDPVMRDLEAFLDSSQERVTGEVTVELFKGSARVVGASSPHSLFDTDVATYGETNTLWDGRDAAGFTQIVGVQAFLASRAGA